MENGKWMKFFSKFLAFVMVLSLLTPLSVSADVTLKEQPLKQGAQEESALQMKAAISEQLQVLEGGPVLHKDLQGLSGSERVPVIIHLSEKPVALEKGIKELAGQQLSSAEATQIKKTVNAQQAFLKKEMQIKKISFEQGFSYNTVLNGFSAKVQAGDLEKLLALDGVTLVEPDALVYASEEGKSLGFPNKGSDKFGDKVVKNPKDDLLQPTMETSISFLGIEELWKEGIEGQGVKVAVLDTGIDADHPDFEGIYKGGKNFVPHTGSDYARERADNDASETSPLDRPSHRP